MQKNTEKYKKQILAIAIPASIGFFFQTMFNVVDTFFAGQIGTTAVAALSLSFPMFLLLLAIGRWLGSASGVLIANALWERNIINQNRYYTVLFLLVLISSIAISILGPGIVSWIFVQMWAGGQYLAYANDYMSIILYGAIFMMLPQVLNGILSSHEDTRSFRNIAIISFLANCILDPLLIFGWWPIPAYGVRGLAWATIILQIVSTIYLWRKVVGLGYRFVRLDVSKYIRYIREISYHAIPAAFNMVTVSLGIFIITYFITYFGEEAVAAYGIATRIEQIVLLPTIGLNIAALSLVGQSMWAKKYGNIAKIYRTCLRYGLYMIVPMTAVVYLLADQLISIFDSTETVVRIWGQYLRIVVCLFWAYVILFVSTSTLQWMKYPLPPLIIGMLRQIIIPVIVWYLCIYIFWLQIESIWWSLVVIIWLSALWSYLWVSKKIQALEN